MFVSSLSLTAEQRESISKMFSSIKTLVPKKSYKNKREYLKNKDSRDKAHATLSEIEVFMKSLSLDVHQRDKWKHFNAGLRVRILFN